MVRRGASRESEFDRQMSALDLRNGHLVALASLFQDQLALFDGHCVRRTPTGLRSERS